MSDSVASKAKLTHWKTAKSSAFFIVTLLFFSIFCSVAVPSGAVVDEARGQSSPEGSSQTDWWSMMRHDSGRTGYSNSSAPTTNYTLWTQNASGYFAVVDGKVFLSSGNSICALNALTGEQIWSTVTPFASGYVTVAYNMVYVQDSNGIIYALNKNNGTLRWNVTFGVGSPAFADGAIFAKSSAGFVGRLNASTGSLTWNQSFAYSIHSDPAVADGMVFVATWNEGKVYALRESNGSQIWQSSYLTWSLESTPVVVGGMVYMGGGDRMIYVLDQYNGSLMKTYGPVGGYLNQGPVVAYGKLFVGAGDYNRTVYAINEISGEIVWSYYIGGTPGPMIEPRVADHKVFVGSMSSPPLLFALNESNGEAIWSFKPNVTGVITDIGIANGKVFSSMGDRFYTFGDAIDVAVLSVTPYKVFAHQGFDVNVSVTVQNEGSETESFKVGAYYNLSGYTLPSGPVGYWSADEGAGTVAGDNSGYNNNGTLYNGTAWADGKCGKALSFDGIDDYVSVPDSPSLDITNNITIEAWICPESYGKIPDELGQYHAGIVSKAGAYSLIFLYSNETHTHIQFLINSTGIHAVTTKAISPALNQWHHIAGVYDSSYLRVYWDGTEIANVPAEKGTLATNNQPLRIGWDDHLGTSARRFDGLIDEIRVYNRTLERLEILADMPYYGEIASQNVTLARAETVTITFTWNTNFTWNGRPFAKGNYTITACADHILGETDTCDNSNFEVVKLSIPGDINGDYKVGPADFALLSVAYGSTPGKPKWNSSADINSDERVGPADFALLSANYGKRFPDCDIDSDCRVESADFAYLSAHYGERFPWQTCSIPFSFIVPSISVRLLSKMPCMVPACHRSCPR